MRAHEHGNNVRPFCFQRYNGKSRTFSVAETTIESGGWKFTTFTSLSHLTVHTPSRFKQSKRMWVGGRQMYWTGPKLEIHFSNVCTVQAQLHIKQTHIHDRLLHSNLASHKFLFFTVTIVTK